MRLVLTAVMAALVAAAAPGAAPARPLSVDDLLHQESFGALEVDPSGRWLVFEQRDPYDTAPGYDHDLQTSSALSRLRVVDLTRPAAARPLLARDPGPGVQLGTFSPSGARLAVYRLDGDRWILGVVTVATGRTRWYPDITPEKPLFGRGLAWLSDRELLLIHRPDRAQPWGVRIGKVSARTLPGLWAAAARGTGAHTVFGSGAYAELRPRAAPRDLLRLDVTRAVPRTLATGAWLDLEVSPDGRRVALLETGASVQAQAGGPVQGPLGVATEASQLRLLDLHNGALTQPCPACDMLPLLMTWSPDSRALLTFARDANQPWPSGRLLRVEAATGRMDRLGAGLTPQFFLRPETVYAGWMGPDPILLARPPGDPSARMDWYRLAAAGPVRLTGALPAAPHALRAAGDHSLTLLVGGVLWQVDAAGQARRVSDAVATALREPRAAADGRAENKPPGGSWMITTAPGPARLQWLDAAGLHPAADLAPGDPAAGDRRGVDSAIVAGSRAAGAAVLRLRDVHGRERLEVLAADGRRHTVAAINAGWGDIDPPIVRRVPHRGPDGQALVSWLLLPPPRPGRPPPLVIRPYLGAAYASEPRELPAERGFVTDMRSLVGHGYAVLIPSLPLAAGRDDPMTGLADRILAIVRAAAADPALAGTFDPDRLALWGHSYGGYSVMAALAQSDRFRAGVSISGLSDLISKWETLADVYRVSPGDGAQFNWSMGSVESGQDEMRQPPWADLDRYRRNSPLFVADRIHTPLLLMHGDQDIIVINQSEAMFAALYRQNRDAQMVVYWGEGHAIGSPGNVRDMLTRAFAFLDAHLDTPAGVPLSGAAAPPGNPGPGPASSGPTPPRPPG